MDAVAAAHHAFELQRQAFIYGDIKSEMLSAFKNNVEAYIYLEEAEDAHYVQLDTKILPIYDDIMSGSFKVGDNFQCKVRENSKERWFQIKYNKTIINLRDPERYFKREEDGIEYFIFVSISGASILMFTPKVLEFSKAQKLLKKMSRSIISYDKHGSSYVKRGVR